MNPQRPQTRTGKASKKNGTTLGQGFIHPERTLQALAPGDAASLIWTAADIALVLDREGVVEDVSASVNGLPGDVPGGWVGRPWVDVVTPESRTKVESLLQNLGNPQWRHVNHPLGQSGDFPVMYRAMSVGRQGRVLALGRDMRGLAQLQQRLVDAQHAVDRDYLRLRNVEARYRLLFERATDAILIVDAQGDQVLEANPMASELLGVPLRRLVGQPLGTGLPERAVRELDTLVDRVRSSGRSEDQRLRVTAPSRLDVVVSASLFTQDERTMILVRMRPSQAPAAGTEPPRDVAVAQLVQGLPDGFVVTSPDGRVLMANKAFVELAQMTREEHLVGESIGRWLGRPGVDLNVMLAALRQQGTLRLFNTVVHGEHGVEADVEISAVAAPEAEPPCVAFNVRHVGRRLGQEEASTKGMPRSVEQLTQLVGRMPLKDLVRESTDLIEQLCIEAALQLTQGNRASAAEMLGLSRQSLYVKLHRYGMTDGNGDASR